MFFWIGVTIITVSALLLILAGYLYYITLPGSGGPIRKIFGWPDDDKITRNLLENALRSETDLVKREEIKLLLEKFRQK